MSKITLFRILLILGILVSAAAATILPPETRYTWGVCETQGVTPQGFADYQNCMYAPSPDMLGEFIPTHPLLVLNCTDGGTALAPNMESWLSGKCGRGY